MATPRTDPRVLIDTAPLTELLRLLAREGEVRRYAKGTLLIDEGSSGDTLFIILDGRLRAFSSHADNGREITYGIYGAGEYVGEMGFDGGPRSASVIVLEPSVCARIERPTLQRFLSEQPQFAFELLAKVIRRARAATLSLKQVALNDVYGRLKHLLEGLERGGDDSTSDRLTHAQIASRIGCGREMVSRVMKDLERGGYVAVDAGRFRIRRPLPTRW